MVQLRSFVSLVGNGCVLDGLVIVTPGFWFRCQGEGRAGLVWVLGPGSREESTWRPAAAAKKKKGSVVVHLGFGGKDPAVSSGIHGKMCGVTHQNTNWQGGWFGDQV